MTIGKQSKCFKLIKTLSNCPKMSQNDQFRRIIVRMDLFPLEIDSVMEKLFNLVRHDSVNPSVGPWVYNALFSKEPNTSENELEGQL